MAFSIDIKFINPFLHILYTGEKSVSQVQIPNPESQTQFFTPIRGSWWYEKRLGLEVSGDMLRIGLSTYGSCVSTFAEIIYPEKLDLRRVSARRGEYDLQLSFATLHVESADSSKNIHRSIEIKPLAKLVLHYYGSISCSKSCNEFILLEPNKEPVALQTVSEVKEEVNGRYRVLREYLYIIVDGKKIQVGVRELEREKIKLVVKVEEVNGKVYVSGDTYDIKDRLKEHGFRWDNIKKAWYTDKLTKDDVVGVLVTIDKVVIEE